MLKTNWVLIMIMISVVGCKDSKKSRPGNAEVPSSTFAPISLICPTGYVAVPFLSGYTTENFCVAKYEMKNNSGAKSEPAGVPWASINRANSIAACSAIGPKYSLITIAQQETIARNINGMAMNWSNGTYEGVSTGGHTDTVPFTALEASSDDAQACYGTGQTCSNTLWDSQRRIHFLSTGDVIWDFAGNVWEWAKDDKEGSAVLRGGSFGGQGGGVNWLWIFTTLNAVSSSNADSDYGFRCVYQP